LLFGSVYMGKECPLGNYEGLFRGLSARSCRVSSLLGGFGLTLQNQGLPFHPLRLLFNCSQNSRRDLGSLDIRRCSVIHLLFHQGGLFLMARSVSPATIA